MTRTALGHSFALEARVCCIPNKDLLVCVQEVRDLPGIDTWTERTSDETSLEIENHPLRPLEQLLQLLADPAFGRR